MSAYIYFQYKAGDFKEFSASFVALLFAVLHMARTMMGLWQLHVFKQWVVKSIISMESLRGRVEIGSSAEDMTKSAKRRTKSRINEVADKILVNNSIVDNRLFGDKFRCSVRFLSKMHKNAITHAANALMRVAFMFWCFVTTMIRILGVLWPMVFSKSRIFSTPRSTQ